MAQYPEPLFSHITHDKKRAFLAAFAHTGRIRRACDAAQMSWKSHYLWLDDDPEYAAAFADATRMAGDFLEDEAIRRALEGWEKKVFHQGQHVDNDRLYSDPLMIFLLKGSKPDRYKDRTQLSGDANAPLEVVHKYGRSTEPKTD
jgi:hypothetical protein